MRALVVEADAQAFRLVEKTLRQAGFEPVLQRVGTAAALSAELTRGRWDIVFSNPLLPGFDGTAPLGVLRAGGHDLPCIVLAAHLDEQRCAAILKAGARDVVRSDELHRLPAIVSRELASARQRRAHQRTQVELAAATARLRTLVDAAPIVVIELDRGGLVRSWNAAAQQICGWTAAQAIGQNLPMLPGEQTADLQAMCGEAQRGHTFAGVETRWLRADGDTIELTVSLAPIGDNEGTLLLMATPRCEMTRLRRSLDRAQHHEAFGQLAQGIAGEIGAPMQVICGELDFISTAVEELAAVVATQRQAVESSTRLNDGDASGSAYDRIDVDFLISEIPRSLGKLRNATTRAGQIVRAISEVSPTTADARRPYDLNRAVECTSTVARSEFRHVADLVLDLQPELPPVMCVPSEISFVLLNLLVNAAHAVAAAAGSRGRGAITVSTAVDRERVVVMINDTGVGIPRHEQPRIFEPFFTTKPAGKGTGQGLARAKSIVERHRGTISFESEEGIGSTFIVRLPRHRAGESA